MEPVADLHHPVRAALAPEQLAGADYRPSQHHREGEVPARLPGLLAPRQEFGGPVRAVLVDPRHPRSEVPPRGIDDLEQLRAVPLGVETAKGQVVQLDHSRRHLHWRRITPIAAEGKGIRQRGRPCAGRRPGGSRDGPGAPGAGRSFSP